MTDDSTRQITNVLPFYRRPAILQLWTVFAYPTDFPKHFVVREFRVGPQGTYARLVSCLCDTLEEARASVPPGLSRIVRQPDDDQCIVETWL